MQVLALLDRCHSSRLHTSQLKKKNNNNQKLQNSALRKILEAFKLSSYMTMKLKAAIISSRSRFNRICKNYALRIMQISLVNELTPLRGDRDE